MHPLEELGFYATQIRGKEQTPKVLHKYRRQNIHRIKAETPKMNQQCPGNALETSRKIWEDEKDRTTKLKQTLEVLHKFLPGVRP